MRRMIAWVMVVAVCGMVGFGGCNKPAETPKAAPAAGAGDAGKAAEPAKAGEPEKK